MKLTLLLKGTFVGLAYPLDFSIAILPRLQRVEQYQKHASFPNDTSARVAELRRHNDKHQRARATALRVNRPVSLRALRCIR
jgi:hypothetical protein